MYMLTKSQFWVDLCHYPFHCALLYTCTASALANRPWRAFSIVPCMYNFDFSGARPAGQNIFASFRWNSLEPLCLPVETMLAITCMMHNVRSSCITRAASQRSPQLSSKLSIFNVTVRQHMYSSLRNLRKPPLQCTTPNSVRFLKLCSGFLNLESLKEI
jgi:hypothetical protein